MRPPPSTRRTRLRLLIAALASALVASAMVAIGVAAGASPASASSSCPPTLALQTGLGDISLVTNCGTVTSTLVPYDANGASYNFNPVIAPDHDHVVYGAVGSSGATTVYVTSISTHATVTVANCGDGFAWSPDSSKIAINCGNEVLVVPAAGGTPTTLSTAGFNTPGITLCNGLVYVPGFSGLESMSATTGGGLTTLAGTNGAENPVCTPDGKWLLYDNTNAASQQNVYAIPSAGGTPMQLTGGNADSAPTVSGDWTMAFTREAASGPVTEFQWLGGTQVTAGPAGQYPSFDPGTAQTAPAGFPIAYGSPAPTPSPTPTPPPPVACPVLKFMGAEGSGQGFSSQWGYYGSTVGLVKVSLAGQVRGLSASPVKYPAIAVGYAVQDYGTAYRNSELAGENALSTMLIAFMHRCPHTYIVVAGYSQGAQVVGNVVDALSAASRRHIAAMLLFGDPRFNGHQHRVDNPATGYNRRLNGIYQFFDRRMRRVPGSLAGRTLSDCLQGDVVCNYSKANALLAVGCIVNACPHLNYAPDGWATKSAYWAVRMWRSLPAL